MTTALEDLSRSFNSMFIEGVKCEMRHKINELAKEFKKEFDEQVEALALATAKDVAIEILKVVEVQDPLIRYKVLIDVIKKDNYNPRT